MGLITLRNMKINGFRSIKEAVVVFGPSGMLLVKGINRDTGGSSGSGKSNVLLALAYAFDYCPLPAKDLQSWGSKQVPSVEVTFEVNNFLYTIRRDSTPTLNIGNQSVVTGARAVNAKLQEITGLDTELLAALTFREQQARGIFLSKSDAEKKEFLTKLLKLDVFEKEYEKSTKQANVLASKLETLNGRLSLLEEQFNLSIKNLKEPIIQNDDIVKREVELQNKTVSTLLTESLKASEAVKQYQKTEWSPDQELTDRLSAYVLAIQEAKEKAPKYVRDESACYELSAVRDELINRLLDSERTTVELNKNHRDLTEVVRSKQRILETLDQLKEKLLALENQMCPECERPWVEGQGSIQVVISEINRNNGRLEQIAEAEQGLIHLEQLQKEHSETHNQLSQARQNVESQLDEAYDRLDLEQSEFEKEAILSIAKLSTELATLKATVEKQATLHKLMQAEELSALRDTNVTVTIALDYAKNHLHNLESKLDGIKRANAISISESDRLKRTNVSAKEALEKTQSEQAQVNSEYVLEVDLSRAIKGFLGSIFDESLIAIAYETNKLIGQLPNTTHITLAFKSEGVNGKGIIKQEIKPVIFVNGHETTLKGGCSGGQRTSIELAVDLAVATVVQERTGQSPGWLILDETFEGQDTITKECCMEMLKQYASNKLVLVVDHSSETKELFTQWIEVEYSNGVSKL